MSDYLTALIGEAVDDIAAYGHSNGVFYLFTHEGKFSTPCTAAVAEHYLTLLSQLPQFEEVNFAEYDHYIEIESHAMRYTCDDTGVVRMILLPHVEGNVYCHDQVLLIKTETDLVKYKIDSLTMLSAPKSCMLYVSQL